MLREEEAKDAKPSQEMGIYAGQFLFVDKNTRDCPRETDDMCFFC
jgi:hypothetical protein